MASKKTWRVASVAMSAAAVLAVVSGCGNSGGTGGQSGKSSNSSSHSSSSGKAITITYWTTGSSDGTKQVIDSFNKKYAGQYHVVFNAGTYNNETEALNSALAAHKAPDIMEESFTPSTAYARQGLVVPITKIFKMVGIDGSKDFAPALWKQATVNGVHYAAPTNALSTLLFYNKKLFKKAGISKAPTTQSEFVADAKKLTDKSTGTWGFIQQPLWPNQFEFPSLIAQFGGKLADAKAKKMLFNSTEGQNALQFEWNTIYKWKVSPQAASNNEYVNLFEKGKNAMVMDGEYDYAPFKKAIGSDLGVAPLPIIGKQQANFLGQNFWWVFKSPSMTAAKEKGIGVFMKYFYENWSPIAAKAGTLPAWENTLNSSVVQNNPLLKMELQQLKYGVLNPAIPNWGTTASKPLYTQIGNALLNKESPKAALDKAAKTMNQSVSQLY